MDFVRFYCQSKEKEYQEGKIESERKKTNKQHFAELLRSSKNEAP